MKITEIPDILLAEFSEGPVEIYIYSHTAKIRRAVLKGFPQAFIRSKDALLPDYPTELLVSNVDDVGDQFHILCYGGFPDQTRRPRIVAKFPVSGLESANKDSEVILAILNRAWDLQRESEDVKMSLIMQD